MRQGWTVFNPGIMPSTWLAGYTGNFVIFRLIADCSVSALATEELGRQVPTTTPILLI